MSLLGSGGPSQTVSEALQKLHQNTTTACEIKSLPRLHNPCTTLIEHAKQLVIDMKGRLPVSVVELGRWHQLPGNLCSGVHCTSITISEVKATYVELYNGIVVTVDQFGWREPNLIGSAR